jgi:alkylated DNA repair dioxygenase AlkB
MPAHHDVRSSDVFTRRLHGTLAAAADRGPIDFPELLLTPGVGARTVQSLAMVAEVVHGTPYRFQDPARFSLAHGGKDRHPYPVPVKVYDETIQQVLVTEYRPGAAIGWHKDRSVFGNVIGLSFISSCIFRFRRKAGPKRDRASLTIEPRAIYLLRGPSRHAWEHSIPAVEALRYSLTFRNVLEPARIQGVAVRE